MCNRYPELNEFEAVTYASSDRPDDFARAIQAALDGGDGRQRDAPRLIREKYDWKVLGARFAARLRELAD